MSICFHPNVLRSQPKPQTPISTHLVITMCLIVIVAIFVSFLSDIDIISQTSGRIIPLGKINSVRNVSSGLVKDVLVIDGSKVRVGDPLIELNKAQINADIELNGIELTDVTSRINALSPYRKIDKNSVPVVQKTDSKYQKLAYARYRELVNQIETITEQVDEFLSEKYIQITMKDKFERQLPLEIKRLDASNTLNQNGFVSNMNLLDQQVKVAQLQSDIELSNAKVKAIDIQINNLRKDEQKKRDTFQLSLLEELRALELRKMELEQSLTKLNEQKRKSKIISPISGTVQELSTLSPGNYVEEGELLLKVVPNNVQPLVEVKIPSKDIGFIQVGQNAIVKVDAYAYTRYGSLPATVSYISQDSIIENNELFYPAHLTLKKTYLDIKGKKMDIQFGMSVEADIITGERSIIDYFIAPIKDNLNKALIER